MIHLLLPLAVVLMIVGLGLAIAGASQRKRSGKMWPLMSGICTLGIGGVLLWIANLAYASV
ncbi:MAG: hypothetical protein QM755_15365 [Luteolibacter sp.]